MTKPNKDSSDTPSSGIAARKIAGLLLTRVIDDKRGLDGLTDKQTGLDQFKALNEQDQALCKAIVRTALVHRGQIELALKRMLDRPLPKGARHLVHTLHCATAQILFMEVADHAAVSIAVTMIGREKRSARFKSLANAVLRRLTKEKAELEPKLRSDKLNTPKWMYQNWVTGFGHEAARAIATHHAFIHKQGAPLDLSFKDTEAATANIQDAYKLQNGTIRLAKATNVTQLHGFAEGAFWVQDAAATLPAKLLNAQKGMKIADLCAAPGGKTAQLAAAGAEVWAVELSGNRLKRLNENLARLNLQAHTENADLFDWQPDQKFDAILLDAPCSSTGTIRRHPDVLWTKTKSDIEALAELQFKMLQAASKLLRDGGTLVFSNCSLDPLEGEQLFERAKKELTDLQPDEISTDEIVGFEHAITGKGTLRSLPFAGPISSDRANAEAQNLGCDGFFCARFVKISIK